MAVVAVFGLLGVYLTGCASSAPAPAPPEIVAESVPGFFSLAQADRGRTSYLVACASCHKTSEFRGPDFEWAWRRQTAWNLFTQVSSNMPEDKPGQLPAQVYADIVAYLLALNDYQVGSQDLEPTQDALAAIRLGAGAEKTKP